MPGETAALCMQITPVGFCHRLPASKNVSYHRRLSTVAISPELPALFQLLPFHLHLSFERVFRIDTTQENIHLPFDNLSEFFLLV